MCNGVYLGTFQLDVYGNIIFWSELGKTSLLPFLIYLVYGDLGHSVQWLLLALVGKKWNPVSILPLSTIFLLDLLPIEFLSINGKSDISSNNGTTLYFIWLIYCV
jgi:hypothetical protein